MNDLKKHELAMRTLSSRVFVAPETSIVEVDLGKSMMTDDVLENLLNLREIHNLYLDYTLVTNNIMKVLEAHPEIRYLNIANTAITDDGLKYLRFATSLRLLYLGKEITDRGVDDITKAEHLEILDIAGTAISAKGIERLLPLTRLNFLCCSKSQATEESIYFLKYLPSLEKIHLAGADDTDPLFLKIQESLPNVVMDW